MASQCARRRTSRRGKTHSKNAFVLLAVVDQVLGRILRSTGAASFGCTAIGSCEEADALVTEIGQLPGAPGRKHPVTSLTASSIRWPVAIGAATGRWSP